MNIRPRRFKTKNDTNVRKDNMLKVTIVLKKVDDIVFEAKNFEKL